MLMLTLSRGKGQESIRLRLPSCPGEAEKALALLENGGSHTVIRDVESNVPNLDYRLYDIHLEDQEQFQKLQRLAELSPSRKKGHEKARKNGMNHRNAEGCSLTLPGRSSVFQIAREKVLPKRSEAAACCKMLPCKRRRPPEQRRVSGTASGE